MFDYIEGKLISIEPNFAVVDIGGWGLKCVISIYTYNKRKTELGKKTKLYIHMILKDDAVELIGFHDTMERQAYVLLNRVPGIGSKAAISILSLLNVSQLKTSILSEDVKTLVSVPGIGKKTAQKMIIELKDRIKELPVEDEVSHSAVFEAREVLVSLGFKSEEIQLALKEIIIDENYTVEDIVKSALKKLSK